MLSTPRSLFWTFAATRLALFAIGAFAVSRMPINAAVLVSFGVLEAVTMTAFATWNWVA